MALRPVLFLMSCRFVWRQPRQAILLLRLSAWLMLLSFLLKFWSLQRVLHFFSINSQPAKLAITPTQLANLLDRLLSLDFFVFTPTCWKRAIILHRFLGLSGFATRVVFGVQRNSEKKLAGHAWLEAQGQPFLEALPPDYFPTYRFPE